MKPYELSEDDIKPRCCAEVGSRANGWHGCERFATVRAEKQNPDGSVYFLYFCRKHEAKANGDKLRRTVRVEAVR